MPLDDIAGALKADVNAVALLPLDAASPEARVVSVDGFNIVFGEALFGDSDITSYPLVERTWVSAVEDETARSRQSSTRPKMRSRSAWR